jgi:hypothetical protein
MAAKISGWGSGMDDLSPSVPERTKRIVSPAATAIFPFRIVPTRILRALEVLQDADGPADVILQRTDRGMNFGVIILRAVAEIHTEGVDASHK